MPGAEGRDLLRTLTKGIAAALAAGLLCGIAATPAAAQSPPSEPSATAPAPPPRTPQQALRSGPGGAIEVPSECTVTFMDAGPEGEGRVKLSGYVDIQCGTFRIQADTVHYDMKTKDGLAEGVVVLDWGNNRISGDRLEFNLARQTGTMEDATGWIEPEAILEAKTIKKLDAENVLIEKGIFTSCTQPVPYWSFRVGKGLFHLNHYAHLTNVRLNVGGVPVFYLPWMLWPIKGDRATGLLFPQWGTSRKYGLFIGDAFFWPFARNADLTVMGEWFQYGGPAAGVELNWLPTDRGRAKLTGFYLDDTYRDERRYSSRFQLHQALASQWRLSADLNMVSDARFNQDFETNLAAASSTVIPSVVSFVRNGEFDSINVKTARIEQFFFAGDVVVIGPAGPETIPTLQSTLIQSTLPEFEVRGRSRRLPGSPLFFEFESSVNYFMCNTTGQGGAASCHNAGWSRLDLQPRISLPANPFPWLSLEGSASLRETYYTAERNPLTGAIDDSEHIDRTFMEFEGTAIGPRFYHVYDSNSAYSSTYKHVIEPSLVYHYVPRVDVQPFVPIIDDRDPVVDDQNLVTFQLTNRLFAKRPPQIAPLGERRPPEASQTAGAPPWSSFATPIIAPPPESQPPISSEVPQPGAEGEETGGWGEGPMSHSPSLAGSVGTGMGSSGEGPFSADSSAELFPGTPEGTGVNSWGTAGAPAAAGAPGSVSPAVSAMDANPVEIFNFTISQPYSFGQPLLCKNGVPPPCPVELDPRTGHIVESTGYSYGPMTFQTHFNPTVTLSLDFRSDYNFVSRTIPNNAISGWYRWKSGFLNATFVRQKTPGDLSVTSQFRIGSGSVFLNRKLTLDGEVGYDLEGTSVMDWRARLAYYTQCCGFMIEYLDRNFVDNPRREIHFAIDLKGIGRFLEPNVSLAR